MTTIYKRADHNFSLLMKLIAAGVLIDLFLIGLLCKLNSEEWAGGVQAVGSIAAIFGSFLLAERTVPKARKTDAVTNVSDEVQRLELIESLLKDLTFKYVPCNTPSQKITRRTWLGSKTELWTIIDVLCKRFGFLTFRTQIWFIDWRVCRQQ